MIFLRQHNLLFFKPHKTAGTSVEIAMSGNSAATDIVTPLGLADEMVRLRMGAGRPTNWAKHKWVETLLNHVCHREFLERKRRKARDDALSQMAMRHPPADSAVWDISQSFLGTSTNARNATYRGLRRLSHFRHHMKPADVASQLGEDVFWPAYKVSMCRHPYEQLVSQAYWRLWKARGDTRCDLGDVHKKIDQLLEEPSQNAPYYFMGEMMICDMVIRYEHLRDDLAMLERQFGLSLLDRLPFTKDTIRQDHRPAHEFLSRRQMLRCYERSRLEFKIFGYDPSL